MEYLLMSALKSAHLENARVYELKFRQCIHSWTVGIQRKVYSLSTCAWESVASMHFSRLVLQVRFTTKLFGPRKMSQYLRFLLATTQALSYFVYLQRGLDIPLCFLMLRNAEAKKQLSEGVLSA